MLTGTTSSGFKWQIEEDAMDDMELLDALAELDAGKLEAASAACLHLLGKPQRTALYEHLRDERGRVRITAVSTELAEILAGMKEGKKS